nr:MAG: hypothetical protein [Apis mellifera filamentous virus]
MEMWVSEATETTAEVLTTIIETCRKNVCGNPRDRPN